MAENQLKRIDSLDFGDDDPFAELKEIMGFERQQPAQPAAEPPRVAEPVQLKPAEPVRIEPVAAARVAPVAVPAMPAPTTQPASLDDDFSIDLEQELLAGFDAEFDEPELPAAPSLAAARPQPVAPPVMPVAAPVVQRAPEPVFEAPVAAEPVFEAETFETPAVEAYAAEAEIEAPPAIAAAPVYREPVLATSVEPRAERPADTSQGKSFSNWIFSKATPAPAVRPQRPAPVAAPAAVAPVVATPVAIAPEPVAEAPEPAFELDDFSLDLDAAEVEAPQPVAEARAPVFRPAAQPVAFDRGRAIEADINAALGADDFDAAFTAQFNAPEPQTTAVAQTADAIDDAFADAFALDDDFASDLTVREPEIRAQADEPVLEFDHDELMRDLAGETTANAAPTYQPEPAYEAAPAYQPAPAYEDAPVSNDVQAEIDFNFDVAMADVDMEFDTSFDEPAAAIADGDFAAAGHDWGVEPQPVAYEPVASEPVAPEPSAYARAMAEAYQPTEAPAEPEISFEDELKALLARPIEPAVLVTDYEQPPLPEPTPVEAYVHEMPAFEAPPQWNDEQDFQLDLDDSDFAPEAAQPVYEPVAEVSAEVDPFEELFARMQPQQEPVAAAPEAPVEADPFRDEEFEAALAGFYAPAEPAAPVAQHYAQAEEAEPVFDDGAFDFAVEDEQRAYAAAPQYQASPRAQVPAPAMDDHAPAFDDNAFDAAFENAMSSGGASDFDFDLSDAAPVAAAQVLAGRAPVATHARRDVPDVETIDVPEAAVAVTGDLNIPEFTPEDDVRVAPAYDEFEPDFSGIFNEMETQPQPVAAARAQRQPQPVAAQAQAYHAGDYETRAYESALAVTAAATAQINAEARRSPMPEWEEEFFQDEQQPAAQRYAGQQQSYADRRPVMQDAPQFDDFGDEFDGPNEADEMEAYEERPAPARRGLMIGAIVGGVALLGVVGAFALSFGGGDSSTSGPAIVRADSDPIKVKPENPGGTVVPGGDNKVFESMKGATESTAPAQPMLNPSSEEPLDIADRSMGDEMALVPIGEPMTGKGEERIAPDDGDEASADSMEVAAVAPRKVKTMVVRSDGTLVPHEEPATVGTTNTQPSALAPALPAEDSTVTGTASKPLAAAPAEVPTPKAAPVAAAPAETVAELTPEPAAAAAAPVAGGWSMQIASQPSEEAAKSTFADLSRKYASVLSGKDASIVKAEIAGKGTFWRVRVAANSKGEATSMCESYKAAGGSCFVSK